MTSSTPLAMLRRVALAAVVMALTAAGCSDSNSPSTNGRLKLYLTDAPASIDGLFITFSSVEAHLNGEWITVRSNPVTVNLLDWNNGASMVLGDAELGPGKYTQIRLMVTNAQIVENGKTWPVDIPSAEQTGLKLVHGFDIVAGTTVELVIDFDAAQSIVRTGNNTYKLKPTIRVVPKPITGAITGTVTNPGDGAIASVKDASDNVVTTSIPEAGTGAFTLAFLPAGTYTVLVTNATGQTYVQSGVVVTAGAVTNIGSVTLQ